MGQRTGHLAPLWNKEQHDDDDLLGSTPLKPPRSGGEAKQTEETPMMISRGLTGGKKRHPKRYGYGSNVPYYTIQQTVVSIICKGLFKLKYEKVVKCSSKAGGKSAAFQSPKILPPSIYGIRMTLVT